MKTTYKFLENWIGQSLIALILIASAFPSQAIPFVINFASPTNGAVYAAPTNIAMKVQVTDSNLVELVQYFANGSFIGFATNRTGTILTNSTQANPFSITWSNVPAGSYSLMALAIDRGGTTATSAPVNITISNNVPSPIPFALSFSSPGNGQIFAAPANVGLRVRVTDSNVVELVQYFANGSFIGTATNSSGIILTNSTQSNPFSITWSNVPAGGYALTALAIDSTGNMATSGPVSITVSNYVAPIIPFAITMISPSNGMRFPDPSNISLRVAVTDSNVIDLVQYFANGSFIGGATNFAGILLTNSAQTNPFSITWSNVATGTYSLTALAVDSVGNTISSAPVNITVSNNVTPIIPFTISLSAPTNGQHILLPANIGLRVAVTDSNVIELVRYIANSSVVGVATNSSGVILTNSTQPNPFSVMWSNPAVGFYTVRAVAVDSAGNTATSGPVTLTVSNNVTPVIPFTIAISTPTNGQHFAAPSNIGIHVGITDSNVVELVQYFANGSFIGSATNNSAVILTNSAQGNPLSITWTNVPAGNYSLTALAIDNIGHTATSGPVNIIVSNSVPPLIPFAISISSPTNGQQFSALSDISIRVAVTDSNVVQIVQYFANGSPIGLVTNSAGIILTNSAQTNPFSITWSSMLGGAYLLTAQAIDSSGRTATSAPVNIVVSNSAPLNVPFAISIYSPTNGQQFPASPVIGICVAVTDSNLVQAVQYFANGSLVAIVSNRASIILTNSAQTNPFSITWAGLLGGTYSLTALAIDNAGNTATSSPVIFTVANKAPPSIPFTISVSAPTNSQRFPYPSNIGLRVGVTDSNLVELVQYFANGSFIGIATNSTGIILTNSTQTNPFSITWSSVPAGNYSLTALAIDSTGNMATSAPVNITVSNNVPPSLPFTISIISPATSQHFPDPATIGLRVGVTDSNVVQLVEYLANGSFIGAATNFTGIILTNAAQTNPFSITWSNVAGGSYSLTALAIDSMGNTATSAPVNIIVSNSVVSPPPFAISIISPTNGQTFAAPANIGLNVIFSDSNLVELVQYFANGSFIGTVSNGTILNPGNFPPPHPFSLTWSNVPAGIYSLTALAFDSAGKTATSAPVSISVLSVKPPVVTIYAPDPVAIEGTNRGRWFLPPTAITNYVAGTNTATFLVRRDSGTNTDLTVHYSISGTASNGVDYATIPDLVVIPAGQRYALITIIPLEDVDPSPRPYDNVILTLKEPNTNSMTAVALPYTLGNPHSAGAIILEQNFLPIPRPIIHGFEDNSAHVSLPGTNGLNYCLQVSSDLVHWTDLCTNTVLKGSAQFVDPSPAANTSVFYRIKPVSGPANY